jgi:hypothetical protein
VVRGLTENGGPSRSKAEPKIGDAGIVGVITGFNSVCIDGTEIGLDGAVPMQIDETTASGTELRAGQVAVIEAVAENGTLRSLHLAVRHELTGPIERQAADGTMTIAGQPVVVPAGTRGGGQFAVGDWVAVSGLRHPDGSILATRLDAVSKGVVTLHGRIVTEGGKLRIGAATVLPPVGSHVSAGMFVAVSGRYEAGVLRAGRLEGDLLAQDPESFFGGSIHRIIERSLVRIDSGRVLLNGVLPVPVAPGVTLPAGDVVDAVVTMDRGADGTYAVTRVDVVPPATAP